MNAMRNMFHGLILAGWAALGVVFTLKCLFGGSASLPTLFSAASWWLWFLGFAAVTTSVVTKLSRAWAPLAVHGLAFLVLQMIPRVFPLSLLRLGLDLLGA